MGLEGMSLGSLLLILLIVLVLFGTKKLRNIGSDLGSAVKGFKQALGEAENVYDNFTTADPRQQSSKADSETDASTTGRRP